MSYANISDAPKLFHRKQDCGCSTTFWYAYLIEYISVPIYDRFTNTIISTPLIITDYITFGLSSKLITGGNYCSHSAVTIHFKCLSCLKKFALTIDLIKSGTRRRFGYYTDVLKYKYRQSELWLARDEMKEVFDEFNFGPEKHSYRCFNCSHFANLLFDAICNLNNKKLGLL